MKTILKSFGKGLLYLITLPVMLVIVTLLATVGIIYFLVLGTKAIILFFQGKSLFKDLPEDEEVRKIKAAQIPQVPEEPVQQSSTNIFITSAHSYNFDQMYTNNETTNEQPIENRPDVETNSDIQINNEDGGSEDAQ